MKYIYIIIIAVFLFAYTTADAQKCKRNKAITDTISLNLETNGHSFSFSFEKGKKHNHPSFAIWLEDLEGNYIQSVFVTQSFGKGVYRFGSKESGHWESGARKYEATLPYFIYKWSESFKDNELHVPSEQSPIPDAYTGATPEAGFVLNTNSTESHSKPFRVLVEFNQPWDVNNFWTNSKYPNNHNYKASCQPSLVYSVEIDPNDLMEIYHLNPIGHGHYAGEDGRLYSDLSGFTTAFEIFKSIRLTVK